MEVITKFILVDGTKILITSKTVYMAYKIQVLLDYEKYDYDKQSIEGVSQPTPVIKKVSVRDAREPIVGAIYYTGRSFWYCESKGILICMSDIIEENDGYTTNKPGNFLEGAEIVYKPPTK